MCFNRDAGILKRTRGTPLPGWSYLSGRVIHSMIVGAILVVITLVFGWAFYDGTFPMGTALLEFVVTFLVGALSFAALALALTGAIPNADAAPPIVNAAILPLLFLSGIFFPLDDRTPQWIVFIGNVFPVKHFADAMRSAYLSKVSVQTPVGLKHAFVVPVERSARDRALGRRRAGARVALLQLGAPEVKGAVLGSALGPGTSAAHHLCR